jgi:hypothetical protein
MRKTSRTRTKAKSKPNRFALVNQSGSLAVTLDPDVARVFKSAESVNAVLRALLTTMPGVLPTSVEDLAKPPGKR